MAWVSWLTDSEFAIWARMVTNTYGSELQAGALARTTRAFRADREPFYPGGWAFPAY